jgi:DNA-binding transcriptional ArsR family regulator
VLDATRRRILERLREPASATEVARALGLPRQRVNYHVRELEKLGLVEEVARRRRRGLEERIVRATARHWLISPEAIGSLGADPARIQDRFSATYQVAVAARTIREVGHLMELAREAGKALPTLTVDTELRFRTPAERDAFAQELVALVSGVVARYHDGEAAEGRSYRLFLGAHPVYRPEG